jgi:hypothetical protein
MSLCTQLTPLTVEKKKALKEKHKGKIMRSK